MHNQIDINQPVAEVVSHHPELIDILVELGFKPLANPVMRNTVGKVTSLKSGAKMTGIDLEKIKTTLRFNGYEVVGDDDGK